MNESSGGGENAVTMDQLKKKWIWTIESHIQRHKKVCEGKGSEWIVERFRGGSTDSRQPLDHTKLHGRIMVGPFNSQSAGD
jgi:hypothetical protein